MNFWIKQISGTNNLKKENKKQQKKFPNKPFSCLLACSIRSGLCCRSRSSGTVLRRPKGKQSAQALDGINIIYLIKISRAVSFACFVVVHVFADNFCNMVKSKSYFNWIKVFSTIFYYKFVENSMRIKKIGILAKKLLLKKSFYKNLMHVACAIFFL